MIFLFVCFLSLLVVIFLFFIVLYNGLVSKRNRVKNAWAQIDVQLKRRHDLIPNLVETAKGYLKQEKDVLQGVTEARARAVAAGNDVNARAAAENALTQAVRSLFAVEEAYPDLKSNQNMLALHESLSSTENKVAFARQFYNDSVMEYNTARETLPSNLVAGAFGFQPADLFQLDSPAEKEVPKVSF